MTMPGRLDMFPSHNPEAMQPYRSAIMLSSESNVDVHAYWQAGALWDDPIAVSIEDDLDIDWQPPAPTHDKYGRPYIRQCADCYGSPVTVDEDGNRGMFCEVCEHRRLRRNG